MRRAREAGTGASVEGVAVGGHGRQRGGVPVEIQVATQCFERVAVGQAEADQASRRGHLVNGDYGATEQNLREAEHRQGESGLRGVGDRR